MCYAATYTVFQLPVEKTDGMVTVEVRFNEAMRSVLMPFPLLNKASCTFHCAAQREAGLFPTSTMARVFWCSYIHFSLKLQIPKPNALTTWEKFSKAKVSVSIHNTQSPDSQLKNNTCTVIVDFGLTVYFCVIQSPYLVQGIKKRKRSRMVFDEAAQACTMYECVDFTVSSDYFIREGVEDKMGL